MSKLKIITTRTKDGNFDKNKESFPNLTEEEIELLYNSNLEKLDINRKNTVIINENNQEEGYLILKKGKKKTETNKEAVVIKDSLTDFFVLAETNDYPVIIGTVKKDDEETAIIALATLNNLKNEILDKMVGYLIHATGCAPFDINFYISACPNKEDLVITDKNLLKARIFKGAIEKKNGQNYLDIRLAIFNDLYNQIVNPECIYFDSTNTVENKDYYSNIGNRPGKNLIGIVFQEDK